MALVYLVQSNEINSTVWVKKDESSVRILLSLLSVLFWFFTYKSEFQTQILNSIAVKNSRLQYLGILGPYDRNGYFGTYYLFLPFSSAILLGHVIN